MAEMNVDVDRRPAPQSGSKRFANVALMAVLVALLVFVTAHLGYNVFIIPGSKAQFFWPPAGIVLALLLLNSEREWPWLLAGAFAGELAADGNSIDFSVASALINLTQSLIAAWLLRSLLEIPPKISSLRSVMALIAGAAIACTALGAGMGAILEHQTFHEPFGRALVLWGVGDGVGFLLITPLMLTWADLAKNRGTWKFPRIMEGALLYTLIAVSGRFLLSADNGAWLADSHAYLTLPLLLWVALRFGPSGAATGTFILGSMLSWNTVRGHGVFTLGSQSPLEQTLQIYIYVTFASLSSLIPAVMFEQQLVTEKALQKSRERYRLLFKCNPLPMWVCDRQTLRFLEANDIAVAKYGYSRDEFLTMQMSDIRQSRDISKLMEHFTVTEAENSEIGLFRHRRKDGTLMDVEVMAQSFELEDREVSVIAAQDVTESRMLVKKMAALQKFEAIGKLAGGVAHDFNNLLGVIMGWAEMARAEVEDGSSVGDGLDRILEQTRRASRLTRQLLAFARQQTLQREELSLNRIITESLDLFLKGVGEHVEVQEVLASDLRSVYADKSQMEQVLLNLVVNARDAMPRGGRLVVETKNVAIDEVFCLAHNGARTGQFVRLSVSDTGVGMDTYTLEQIFDPFFTTKGVGKGTGLGLATVEGIVKQHEGFINVTSKPNCGATFQIYMPASAHEAKTIEKVTELQTVRGLETILVVDDHDALRDIALVTLKQYGYEVLEASNGQEALEVFRANRDQIDLVVSDVVMPTMSGPEAINEMLVERPGLAVLFVTGYGPDLQLISDAGRVGLPMMQKPYPPRMLVTRVRELLDEGRNQRDSQISDHLSSQ